MILVILSVMLLIQVVMLFVTISVKMHFTLALRYFRFNAVCYSIRYALHLSSWYDVLFVTLVAMPVTSSSRYKLRYSSRYALR